MRDGRTLFSCVSGRHQHGRPHQGPALALPFSNGPARCRLDRRSHGSGDGKHAAESFLRCHLSTAFSGRGSWPERLAWPGRFQETGFLSGIRTCREVPTVYATAMRLDRISRSSCTSRAASTAQWGGPGITAKRIRLQLAPGLLRKAGFRVLFPDRLSSSLLRHGIRQQRIQATGGKEGAGNSRPRC